MLAFALLLVLQTSDYVTIDIPGSSLKKRCLRAEPEKCSMVLPEQQPAPFSGILSTFKSAAEVTAKAEYTEARIEEAAANKVKEAKLEVETAKRMAKIDLDAKDEKIEILNRALKEAGPSWYERPIVVVPATVVATLGVIAVSVVVVQSLKKD